jgi:hypothetical protein
MTGISASPVSTGLRVMILAETGGCATAAVAWAVAAADADCAHVTVTAIAAGW